MESYKKWKLGEPDEDTLTESERVKSNVPKLNAMSAKQINESDMLDLLPVGRAAAVISGSRFFKAMNGCCINGHPPIRKVTKEKSVCVFCANTHKKEWHKKRLQEDFEYANAQKEKQRNYRLENLDKIRAAEKLWRKITRQRLRLKR